jgi:penicillin-binding protein 1C
LYLNLAPYGNEIVGIGRASRAYFGCAPSLLTPAQAAFLAALPQRPSEFDPYRQPGAAVARTRFVIGRMEALGWLSAAQAQEARAERLVIAPRERPWLAPHFVQMVLAGATPARTSRIETTLDAALQRDVEGIVRAARPGLERHRAHNIAVVVLDNETGGWLAWEGSGDYFDAAHGGAIDGVTTPRQPGSALKPFTYALAFDRGFSPATVLPDLPSHFPTADPGVVYVPRNYDGRYRGPLRARLALAGSENVPAVAVVSDVGVPTLVRLLRRAGLTTFEKTAAYYGLGATLGDGEVTLAELVSAYAALARGGEWQRPHYLAADARRDPVRVVSERAAFWVSDILCDNDAREFVFGRGGALEFDVPVAVKTGTSQGYHDNWTIGFTRAVTVGVWVGNFDRTPLVDSSGVTGAAPIFHAVMLAARARVSSSATLATAPPNVTRARICALSGMRANRWCPSQISEWLPVENPPLPCSWHHLSDGEVVVVWPAEYREWARRHSADPEPEMPRAAVAAASAPSARQTTERFAIVSPPPGAIYLMDPTLRRSFQSLPLRAIGGQGAVDWQVDGKSVGIAADHRPLMWPLAVGVHHLAARDAAGRTADVEIVVK